MSAGGLVVWFVGKGGNMKWEECPWRDYQMCMISYNKGLEYYRLCLKDSCPIVVLDNQLNSVTTLSRKGISAHTEAIKALTKRVEELENMHDDMEH